MKNLKNEKAFTIIELIVVVAILGVLVLLAGPKLLGYVEKAELTRIQHDVKVMEQEMKLAMLDKEVEMNKWDNNAKDLGALVLQGKLFEKEGVAERVDKTHLEKYYNNKLAQGELGTELGVGGGFHKLTEGIGGELIPLEGEFTNDGYKIIPDLYKGNIGTRLGGTFYTNDEGKVYYEHDKPLSSVKKEQVLACVSAETLDYEFEIIDGKGTITGWNGTELHLIIPSAFLLKVDGVEQCVPVQVIGRAAFANGPLRSIVIPESVDTIEENAFRGTEITKTTIPHSVQYIGGNAFADTPLTNATIINKPEYIVIGENAFGGITPTYKPPTAKDLNIIFDTKTNTIISGGSFGGSGSYSGSGGSGGSSGGSGGSSSSGGSGGSSSNGGSIGRVITIPKFIIVNGIEYPVKEISQGAYQGSGLISVILPEGLERIEDYAFAGNQLIGVTIPESVNYIGNYAFAFNEATHTITGDVKGTIKSVFIKGNQYVDDIDGLGNITTPINEITLKDHVWVTSKDNHVINEDYNPIVNDGNNDNGGDETEDGGGGLTKPVVSRDPMEGEIVIDSADKLANIGKAGYPLNGEYILTDDIDLSSFGDWAPIGNNSTSSKFRGSFNGNGYSITGLKINKPTTDYVGLFGYTDKATIENVALEDVDITGEKYTGGLVGYADASSIINSYATGSVEGTEDRTGGLVGYAYSSTITNSYATGAVTGTGTYTGGLVGRAGGSTIINSYATGSVSGINNTGGLVGWANSSSIENSHATGSVIGGSRTGGLVGEVDNWTNITNSYATGSVTSTRSTGGLVGYTNSYTTITDSYATGAVTGTSEVGGLVGYAVNSSTISSSYWDKETTGQSTSAGGGTGKSTEEMKMKDTYRGWDFGEIWQINEGKSYPTLR